MSSIYICESAYTVFCIILSFINLREINYNKHIYHGLNGAAHFCCWAAVWFISHSWLVFILPFIGRLFFDAGLNIIRLLDIGYVARNPVSIVDVVEYKLFGLNGKLPKGLYLLLILAANIASIWLPLRIK